MLKNPWIAQAGWKGLVLWLGPALCSAEHPNLCLLCLWTGITLPLLLSGRHLASLSCLGCLLPAKLSLTAGDSASAPQQSFVCSGLGQGSACGWSSGLVKWGAHSLLLAVFPFPPFPSFLWFPLSLRFCEQSKPMSHPVFNWLNVFYSWVYLLENISLLLSLQLNWKSFLMYVKRESRWVKQILFYFWFYSPLLWR